MKPKLIPNWRNAWKFWSMRFLWVIALWPLVYESLPKSAQDAIPFNLVVVTLAVGGMVSRMIQQGILNAPGTGDSGDNPPH